MIKNIYWSSCKTLFLSNFNYTWIYSTNFSKNTQISDFTENPTSGSRAVPCGQSDRRTDMTKLIVAFRDFSNAPKTCHCPHITSHILRELQVSQRINEGTGSRSVRFGAVILPRISKKHTGGEIGLRTAFFWVIMQRVVVISYRRFGATSRFNLQVWRIQKRLGCCNSRLISSNHRNEIRFINNSEEKTFCSISTSTSKTSKFWEGTRIELVLTVCIKPSFYAL
jgi:hypothetical protein